MDKIKTLVLSLVFAVPAFAGTLTTDLSLQVPAVGDTDYATQIENSFNILDAAVLDKRAGGTVDGDLIVTNGSLIGDGSLLTGIPSGTVFFNDDLTSLADGLTYDFSLSTEPATNSVHVVLDGLTQRDGVDFTISGNVLSMSTAPIAATNSFFVAYSTSGAAGGAGGGVVANAPILGIGSIGDPLRLDSSSVTLLGPTIDQSEVSFTVVDQALVDQLGVSTDSLQVQIDALGGGGGGATTVFADAPILGDGSSGDHLRLDTSSVTLLGPSPDHALLSNITASDHHVKTVDASELTTGTLPDARLSANVTTQGNTFNGANQLVQLDGSARLPAVDGSQLTNLPGGSVFGTEFSSASAPGDQSTNGGAFTSALQLVTPVIPAGNYMIQYRYGWSHSVDTSNFRAQLDLNLGTILRSHDQEPADPGIDQLHIQSDFVTVALSNASHTIDVEFARTAGGTTATIRDVEIVIFRIN